MWLVGIYSCMLYSTSTPNLARRPLISRVQIREGLHYGIKNSRRRQEQTIPWHHKPPLLPGPIIQWSHGECVQKIVHSNAQCDVDIQIYHLEDLEYDIFRRLVNIMVPSQISSMNWTLSKLLYIYGIVQYTSSISVIKTLKRYFPWEFALEIAKKTFSYFL